MIVVFDAAKLRIKLNKTKVFSLPLPSTPRILKTRRTQSTLSTRRAPKLSPCRRHLLPDTAELQKIGLLALYQIMKHNIGLMNQNNADIGYSFIASDLNRLSIGGAVIMVSAIPPGLHCLFVVFFPQFQLPHPQIILIINEQLLQTGLCNVC